MAVTTTDSSQVYPAHPFLETPEKASSRHCKDSRELLGSLHTYGGGGPPMMMGVSIAALEIPRVDHGLEAFPPLAGRFALVWKTWPPGRQDGFDPDPGWKG